MMKLATDRVRFLLLAVALVWAAAPSPGAGPSVVFPRARWDQATPRSQGIDEVKLRSAIAHMEKAFGPDGARQLVIVRNGRLIWQGPDSEACHEIYSATKVFTSTVLGVLIGDGACTLDTRVVELLADLDDRHPAYGRITLGQLASMRGGYRGKVVRVLPGQPWGDPCEYALRPEKPEFEPPGSQIAYNDHDVHLLGRVLATRLAKEPLNVFFKRRIADPIGMTRWEWGVSGRADGMDHCNAAGTPALKANGGVRTTPGELARLGWLYLNRGAWNGKQVLPAAFVDQATSNQVPANLPGRSRSLLAGAYGLYWWTNGVMATGKRRWPAAPPRTCGAHGASTNFCVIVPEWNLVIARLGHKPIPGTYVQQDRAWDEFFALLGAAMLAPPAAAP